ncbi:phiRV1 phage protein [Mycobacterium tuberculosis EAS054]|nr:phiRV1 phage protein [Mycobacterium tuberculosis EAS054]
MGGPTGGAWIASGPWAGSYLGETNGAAGRRIAELERPKAKQRQREGQDHGRQARYSGLGPMGYKPESERHSTKTDTAIGAALGISAGTYRRLKRIDNATHSDDKEIRGPAPLSRGRPRLALSYLRGSLHLQNSKRVAHQHI